MTWTITPAGDSGIVSTDDTKGYVTSAGNSAQAVNDPVSLLKILPHLVQDSASGTLVNGRTSTANYFDDTTGLLTEAAIGEVVWENGLRHENASASLLSYARDLTNGVWVSNTAGTGVAPVITPNYGISPDGTMNATRVQFDLGAGWTNGSNSSGLQQATTNYTIGIEHVSEMIVKPIGTTTIADIMASYIGLLATGGSRLLEDYEALADGWYIIKRRRQCTSTSGNVRFQLVGSFGVRSLDILFYSAEVKALNHSSPIISLTTPASRTIDSNSIPIVNGINFKQTMVITLRVVAKSNSNAGAKNWLTNSAGEGLTDDGSGNLVFTDNSANAATVALGGFSEEDDITVGIVVDSVSGLMYMQASKNGSALILSSETTYVGLTAGANWLFFNACTNNFKILYFDIEYSPMHFNNLIAYQKKKF